MASTFLRDAHPALILRWVEVLYAYREAYPGHDLLITATYRSPEEQALLHAKGRTAPGSIVTQLDGSTHLSNHNLVPSRALDFAVLVAGKISWDNALYEPVGALAETAGLVWGGHWTTFKDRPHVELPKDIT